jgi:hypothetical protein
MALFDRKINQLIVFSVFHTAKIRIFPYRTPVLRKVYRIAYPILHLLLLLRITE